MVDPKAARLELFLQGSPDTDPDQLDRDARQLRSELHELNLGPVDLETGKALPGTKSGDGFVLGRLLMEVLPNAVSPVIEFLRAWTLRRDGRTIKIKAVLKDRSVEMEVSEAVSLRDVKALVNSIIKELEHTGD